MRVFIMDGSPTAGSALDGYLESLTQEPHANVANSQTDW